MTAAVRRSFSSFAVPNYRRFFAGQVISITGNWMQIVAETWLVVQLTGNGVNVGVAAGLQFLPILLFGAYGGAIADRYDKRRILFVTQSLMILPAATLALLSGLGSVQIWMLYVLIVARGLVNSVDNPARQSFVSEIVGADRVVNAVSLNGVIVHTARIAGPMLAGAMIALVGVTPCFAANALSFAAFILALWSMDPSQMHLARREHAGRGQVRAAVREVLTRPELRIPLAMMALVGTLAFNFQVILPLLARFTWHGTATTYALLTSAMGVGAVLGALTSGARGRVSPRILTTAAGLFGLGQLAVAVAPSLWLQMLALVPVGVASVTFSAGVNSSLQLGAGEGMRARVLALYAVVFLGTTPIGAPIAGAVAETAGPRWALVMGGAAALLAAAGARLAYRRAGLAERRERLPEGLGAAG